LTDGTVAKRYAEALFQRARQIGTLEQALGELDVAAQVVNSSPQFLSFLSHPEIPAERKMRVLEHALGRVVGETTLAFLAVLVRRGRQNLLQACVRELRVMVEDELGVIPAVATAAAEMEPSQNDRLRRALERLVGRRVELRTVVDPSVIAGVRVTLRDRVIDGTAQWNLQAMRQRLRELELRTAMTALEVEDS
jgi:F-type H+-transporting ATPase subunit delta